MTDTNNPSYEKEPTSVTLESIIIELSTGSCLGFNLEYIGNEHLIATTIW